MLGWLAAAAGMLAAGAAWAERRRERRRVTHGPGWMPWQPLIVAATFLAVVLAGYALRG